MSASLQDRSNAIKHQLRTRYGLTVKAWAAREGFSYQTVSQVLRGVNKGSFGEGREIAIRLGLISNEADKALNLRLQ